MNMDQLKEFVSLEKRKKELDSELKAIAARLDDPGEGVETLHEADFTGNLIILDPGRMRIRRSSAR